MNKRMIAVISMTAAAAALGMMASDTLEIERAEVPLRERKGRAEALVTELRRGQVVEVIGRSGKWLQLRAGEQTGWVHEADLKPRSKAAAGAAVVLRDVTAGGVEEGAAGKGVSEGAAVYARSKGVSAAPLDGLVARRKQIVDGGEWVKFATEGKVGVR